MNSSAAPFEVINLVALPSLQEIATLPELIIESESGVQKSVEHGRPKWRTHNEYRRCRGNRLSFYGSLDRSASGLQPALASNAEVQTNQC